MLDKLISLIEDKEKFLFVDNKLYVLFDSILLFPVVDLISESTDMRSILLREQLVVELPKDKDLIIQYFLNEFHNHK